MIYLIVFAALLLLVYSERFRRFAAGLVATAAVIGGLIAMDRFTTMGADGTPNAAVQLAGFGALIAGVAYI